MSIDCMLKRWDAPVYVFFKPSTCVKYYKGCKAHVFECTAMCCCCKSRYVQCFLYTSDTSLTSNLCWHAKICWGEEVVKATNQQGTSRLHTRLCQRKEDWMDQSLWHLNGLGIVRSLTVCMHTPNWRHSIFEHMHLFLSPKNKPFSAEFVH